MGRYLDLFGTTKQAFMIGLNGVRLKNSSGNLQVRNKADTDYADITAKALNVVSITLDGTPFAPLGYTAENIANKDTDGTLAANSDTKYPSQKAVKTYSDTKLSPSGDGSSLTGITKGQVGLGNVENTALSTWAGTENITTLGTIATGIWNAGAITSNGNLTLVNSTTNMSALIYETKTDASNYNYLLIKAANTGYMFTATQLGMGITARPFIFTNTLQQATGNESAFQINYTTNKASSGNDTGLLITMTDTASPGTSLVINAQIGATSIFKLFNSGTLGVDTLVPVVNPYLQVGGGTNSTANNFSVSVPPIMTQTSGNNGVYKFVPTYNQASGTAANTDSLINRTETLGSNLISNGTFTSDLTGWSGINWAQNTGRALHTPGNTSPLTQAAATVTSGLRYRVTFDSAVMTTGTIIPSCGGVTGLTYGVNGSYVFEFLATATTALAFTPTTDFDGAIDNVVMKQIAVGSGAQYLGEWQVGGVQRAMLGNYGKWYYKPLDGGYIAPSNPIVNFSYSRSVNDDDFIVLFPVTTTGHGWVTSGDMTEYTEFYVNSTGTVTLLNSSANVVANADTDAKLCIGTAAAQEPLFIKNRLGSAKTLNIFFYYD